jgi:hypothetical protein
VTELLSGQQKKNDFYERMFYFSYFRNQLAFFGGETYKKWYRVTRRPRVVPIGAIQHLRELGISTSDYL